METIKEFVLNYMEENLARRSFKMILLGNDTLGDEGSLLVAFVIEDYFFSSTMIDYKFSASNAELHIISSANETTIKFDYSSPDSIETSFDNLKDALNDNKLFIIPR